MIRQAHHDQPEFIEGSRRGLTTILLFSIFQIVILSLSRDELVEGSALVFDILVFELFLNQDGWHRGHSNP